MSRGYGAIQRKVLDMLFTHSLQPAERDDDTWLTVYDMADELTPADQPHLDVSLIESIRRAVKKLEAAGEVETRKTLEQRSTTRNDRGEIKRMLAARLPLSTEDTARHREQVRADLDHINRVLRGR